MKSEDWEGLEGQIFICHFKTVSEAVIGNFQIDDKAKWLGGIAFLFQLIVQF
jgi:hypothetical protein